MVMVFVSLKKHDRLKGEKIRSRFEKMTGTSYRNRKNIQIVFETNLRSQNDSKRIAGGGGGYMGGSAFQNWEKKVN
jgi:hypothetical protein